MNLFQRGVYEATLEGKGPLREVHFSADPDGTFDGISDVFGDGSLWAIWVPGHTPGSIAFLARFVARHPAIDVRLGHQKLDVVASAGASAR
jgi:glyoxylase-like metal-dependent hydrolase (beta-lactamase superfamily II)